MELSNASQHVIEIILSVMETSELIKTNTTSRVWSKAALQVLHRRDPYLSYDGVYRMIIFHVGSHSYQISPYQRTERLQFYREKRIVTRSYCSEDTLQPVLRFDNGKWKCKWENWKCAIKFCFFRGDPRNNQRLWYTGYCSPSLLLLDPDGPRHYKFILSQQKKAGI